MIAGRYIYAQAREQGEGRREAVTAALRALVDREKEREVRREAERAVAQRRERGRERPSAENRLKGLLAKEGVVSPEPRDQSRSQEGRRPKPDAGEVQRQQAEEQRKAQEIAREKEKRGRRRGRGRSR